MLRKVDNKRHESRSSLTICSSLLTETPVCHEDHTLTDKPQNSRVTASFMIKENFYIILKLLSIFSRFPSLSLSPHCASVSHFIIH